MFNQRLSKTQKSPWVPQREEQKNRVSKNQACIKEEEEEVTDKEAHAYVIACKRRSQIYSQKKEAKQTAKKR